MTKRRLTLPAGWLLQTATLALVMPSFAAQSTDGFEFFEQKIRPVLVERCYKCHSAQTEKLKGNLRLDSREGLLKGGESATPAIVPGHAERSRLIEAIQYRNGDLQMPPPKEGRLTDAQVADFIAWVNMGAPDPRIDFLAPRPSSLVSKTNHWAFKPPKRYPIPTVRNTTWPHTPIDQFILAKLEAHNLEPASPADRRTLIRRATFDLIGLPPTPQEVEAFVSDKSTSAFAKVVDRLLGSPRYGERWGRYWLDVARYADTKGYVYGDREEGRFVHSYVFRDWVIRAFNDDMPYDRFLMLQIAADQCVSAQDRDSLAAMGFLTLGRRFLGVVHDIIDDRIDVVMRGTQGLTVGCARCHDHKFDPISTRDYYSLYGVFAGSFEKTVPLNLSPERTENYLAFEKDFTARTEKLEKTFQAKRDALTDRLRAKAADYLIAVLDADKLPTEEHYEIRGPDDLNPVIVRQWQAYLLQTAKSFHPIFSPWHELAKLPPDNFAASATDVLHRLLRNDATANDGDANRLNPVVARALTESQPKSMRDVAQLYGKLLTDADKAWREAWKAATNQNPTTELKSLPDLNQETIRQVIYSPESPANVPSGAVVDIEWFFDEGSRVELAKAQAEIERGIIKSAGAPPFSVILEDRAMQKNPRVFKRGNPATKGEEVPRQFLEVVAGEKRQPFSIGSGRLELARAIASAENPLTARVMVNRIWQHHFGVGLVRTPSDFGTRCEPPSHPELLDWLALRFIDDEWSMKKLHRLIMLSSVYQQSSEAGTPSPLNEESAGVRGERTDDVTKVHLGSSRRRAEADTATSSSGNLHLVTSAATPKISAGQVDPENRLLWHFNRQRLDFETMRDWLLAATGELDPATGGKAVELFKPPFSSRRAVYGFIDRQFLPGVFRVFDFANPDMHSPQRIDTTVPQQALFFMNSPFTVERARALAARTEVASARKPEARIEQLYELLYQRQPTPRQVEAGVRFIKSAEAEPPPEPPKIIPSPWKYGYGEFDETTKQVKDFQPLPHFTGEAWQGGPKWPDERLGWVQLTAEGGHAGNDLQHAAVRRWIAPQDGAVSISGTIHHEHKEGDGIRALVVSSRAGLLGSWALQNKKEETKFEAVEVKAGDTLDFVVDFRANLNSDDFKWAPVIKLAGAGTSAGSGDYPTEWNARKEFSGPPVPPPKPLNAWEKYAQVLLLANEFSFVD